MQGAGTQSNPYLVSTPQDLHDVRNNLSANYELTRDIDMSNWGNFTSYSAGVPYFTGDFNGNGYKIINLTSSSPRSGLFGTVSGGKISNLGIVDCNLQSNDQYSSPFGYLIGGAIVENCYSTGYVSGTNHIGGLVSMVYNGTVINSYSTCTVNGTRYVGGLAARLLGTSSNIYSSFSHGLVTGNQDIGGLVGLSTGNTSNSFWDTETSGQTTSAGGTGRTTQQMKTQSTYSSWDFINTWQIDNDYPQLQVFANVVQPPKIETIGVTSYVSNVHTNLDKSFNKVQEVNSFVNDCAFHVTVSRGVTRKGNTFTLPIQTSIDKATRSVRTGQVNVVTCINPIHSMVERKSKTIQRLTTNIESIFSGISLVTPLRNDVVIGYGYYLSNPSYNFVTTNSSYVSEQINPSYVEVIK
ncbi:MULTISPECIES: hypothetical protein [Bacillaceae]|uniref:Uncharacterized protein n=1 Tax=Evansella alkalicola TaxID=745819 RepID=A0ABS6JS70_9BACI|nr:MULTISPECIES: hypothetical protein [Bacillaceae]MBU9720554.1 hypothetical protein [Bacillus alkalicola]